MVGVDALREMFRYTEWADGRVWEAVERCPPAASDPEIRDRLLHLHTVQRAFLSVWNGQPPRFPDRATALDLGSIRAWGRPFYREVMQFLATADPSTLERPIVMPWVAEFERTVGRPFAVPSLGETAFQLVNHTTHHRGQVTARLRSLGGDPPLVDYIGWVWFGRG